MHIELTPDQHSWQDEANCLGVDPDLFFPERGASTCEAKEVCRGCVVRMDCLEYALDNGEKFGSGAVSRSGSGAVCAASDRRPTAVPRPETARRARWDFAVRDHPAGHRR